MRNQMIKMIFLVLVFMVGFFPSACENRQEPPPMPAKTINAGPIASAVCPEVGTMTAQSPGTKGSPIMILEEIHTSRVAQFQEAVMMVRLHDKHGLKDIALEAYLLEQPPVDATWFHHAAKGLPLSSQARVAARLLKEGEISAAEFMALVYPDVLLHPIETTAEYSVGLPESAQSAPILYLVKIAQQSLREEHIPRLQELQGQIEQLSGKEKEDKIDELLEYILSIDPWVQDKLTALKKDEIVSAEQHLALIEEILARVGEVSAELEPEEREAMEAYVRFYRSRVKASKTMIDSTGMAADKAGVSVVTMIVGAAHTQGMGKMLRAAQRPFAVLTPLALQTHDASSDLTMAQLDRKYLGWSVYTEGCMEILSRACPPKRPLEKKYPPVLDEQWFQAKSELYLFTERITFHVLGPPAPPGGGDPPYGLSGDDFKGNRVMADVERISIIPDADDKGRAVLFPAILNPNDDQRKTEIWIKAGLGVAVVDETEKETVEDILKSTLEDLKTEPEPATKIEDAAGRVQITLNTVAGIAKTKIGAQKIVLGI